MHSGPGGRRQGPPAFCSSRRPDCTTNQGPVRFGPRSFRVSGPVVWNSLPEDVRTPELSLERFKSMLKTHLFRQAYALSSAHSAFVTWLGRLISVSYIYIYITRADAADAGEIKMMMQGLK